MERPYPSSSRFELAELSDFYIRLTPAPDMWEWLQAEILADTGSIHNEDHAQLLDADRRLHRGDRRQAPPLCVGPYG